MKSDYLFPTALSISKSTPTFVIISTLKHTSVTCLYFETDNHISQTHT